MSDTAAEELFEKVVNDPDKDGGLKSDARDAEPRNFFHHVIALSCSKVADGLIDPKLVLSWLLTNLGAGAFLVGLLVPVREAGSLLPQIFTAGAIHGMPRRKWAWAAGSAGQGIAAAGIVLSALFLEGQAAGIAIVALLALLAVSRSVCSVSFKDILGKTVGKSRRGTVSGGAASVASVAVIVFAGLLLSGLIDRLNLVIGAITLAALGWFLAAVTMASLKEFPDEGQAKTAMPKPWATMKQNPQLARFILVRSLLVGTALAPPYLVMLASSGQQETAELGGLVLASAIASFISSYVWGRLSDKSSRRVMIYAGLAAAIALGLAIFVGYAGLASTVWAMPLVLFGLMVAYHGVRQARSTHLVDMAGPDQRAEFTAVSNTLVGVFLLIAGAAAAALANFGAGLVIGVFLVMSVAGAVLALGLDEVQE